MAELDYNNPIRPTVKNQEELFQELSKYIGKHIGTACDITGIMTYPDTLLKEQRETYGGDCGILQEVYIEGDLVWITSDYGLAWIVTTNNLRIYLEPSEPGV